LFLVRFKRSEVLQEASLLEIHSNCGLSHRIHWSLEGEKKLKPKTKMVWAFIYNPYVPINNQVDWDLWHVFQSNVGREQLGRNLLPRNPQVVRLGVSCFIRFQSPRSESGS